MSQFTDDLIFKAIIAVVSAGLAYLFASRRSLKQNTFELNKEFHSSDFLKSRSKAHQLLKDNKYKNIKGLESDPDFEHLSQVLHFFSNIQNMKTCRLLDKRLARIFFRRYFDHFHQNTDQLFNLDQQEEWAALKKDLDDLNKWL